jgi:hypothetical protein
MSHLLKSLDPAPLKERDLVAIRQGIRDGNRWATV